ncbi:MAG: hypothetical protein FWE51_01475 [Coriobacteriia bacterium]|nr:hypothetical protein [Coriobacteriia bacterium]
MEWNWNITYYEIAALIGLFSAASALAYKVARVFDRVSKLWKSVERQDKHNVAIMLLLLVIAKDLEQREPVAPPNSDVTEALKKFAKHNFEIGSDQK